MAVVLATWIAFLPSLSNDFVGWDDEETLLGNPYIRAWRWSHVAWMFTTFHMGHYQPLSWLTFALDHSIWGMNPAGYHLTNLLLHSGNALAFYFVSRRLLLLASPEAGEQSWPLIFSAGFAALFFALHPLRVESVAWATERRDVLSSFFYLGAIYAYLRAQEPIAAPTRRSQWLAATVSLYVFSLLAKATAITFPVVLILLDIYPLRRLAWNFRRWFAPEARGLWREKIPFIALALCFAWIALSSQSRAAALKSFDSYSLGARAAQVLFGSVFYLWKTVVPTGLSPLYEIPASYGLWDFASLAAGAAALAIFIGLLLVKDRWPAGLVCWLYYLALLAPVLGAAQSGPQLVADRYSYLSCLSWAVLGGGLLLFLWQRGQRRPDRLRASSAIGAGALAVALALAILTWRQCLVWRDTETLWAHVVELDLNASYGHYNLAREIARKGRYQEAIRHYREAIRIRPDADSHNNLGLLLALTGEVDASVAELRRAVAIDPRYAKGYFNLGRVLARRGDFDAGAENFRIALDLQPDEVEIHLALGAVLMRQNRVAEAGERFKEAVRIRPDSADAHSALARWFAGQSMKEQAANHYQEALRLMKQRAQQLPPSRSPGASGDLGAEKAMDERAR
ncbi:MAG TPA: tetratricopeptide repeat protein [Candidatus Binatia bacterium]|nr:tetratricopeptide repeat protein [Candidatus Binatia bacterium]